MGAVWMLRWETEHVRQREVAWGTGWMGIKTWCVSGHLPFSENSPAAVRNPQKYGEPKPSDGNGCAGQAPPRGLPGCLCPTWPPAPVLHSAAAFFSLVEPLLGTPRLATPCCHRGERANPVPAGPEICHF